MLSSIILSVAMTVSPTPAADMQSLDIQEVGHKRGGHRGGLRINDTATPSEVGHKRGGHRGGLRINDIKD